MISSTRRFLQKTNKWIQFYYYETCFCSFFGGNWRHQKDISKLTDLYFLFWRPFCDKTAEYFMLGLFLFFLIVEVDFAPANWIQLFIKSGSKRTFARRTTKIKLLICFSYHNGLRLSTSTGCLNFNNILINY